MGEWRKWIQSDAALRLSDIFRNAPAIPQYVRDIRIGLGTIRIELERLLPLLFRCFPIPFARLEIVHRYVGLSESIVNFNRARCCLYALQMNFLGPSADVFDVIPTECQACIGFS